MQEFRTNRDLFNRRTRRRLIIDISVLGLLAFYFLSDWSIWIPGWIEVSVLVVIAVIIIFDLFFYSKARAIAENLSIKLMDDALVFNDKNNTRQISYDDFMIKNVRRKQDKVVEIRLKTSFKQNIKIRGLENMQELYKGLLDHGVKQPENSH